MAKKITTEIAIAMATRYKELGSYAAVAKEFGISATTASRYIKEQDAIKTYDVYSGPAPTMEPRDVYSFSTLSNEEKASREDFYDEFF